MDKIVESSLHAVLQGLVPCPVCFDWANWENCTVCGGTGWLRGWRALEIMRDCRRGDRENKRYFQILGDDSPIAEALRPLLHT